LEKLENIWQKKFKLSVSPADLQSRENCLYMIWLNLCMRLASCLLADRTNGRAYATVLRLSCVVVCDVCTVTKRCVL